MGARYYSRRELMGRALPYDAEVDYVGIRQGQWIDTEYVPTGTDIVIEATIRFQGYPTTSNYIRWFVARNGAAYRSYRMIKGTSNSALIFNNANNDSNGKTISFTPVVGTSYNIRMELGKVIINGATYTTDSVTTGTENTDRLRIGSNTSALAGTNMDIYMFRVYKSGVLVLDLLPVRLYGIGYLYDKISKRLLGNLGSGSLIVGNEIVKVSHLRTNGICRVPIYFVPTGSDNVFKADVNITNLIGDYAPIFIAYTGETNEAYRIIKGTGTYDGMVRTCCGNDANKGIAVSFTLNERHKIELGSYYITIDGVTTQFTNTSHTGTNTSAMTLFNRSGSNRAEGVFYGFEVYKGGNLKRKIIPVRINNTGYLYDEVDRIVLPVEGGGSFVLPT